MVGSGLSLGVTLKPWANRSHPMSIMDSPVMFNFTIQS